MNSINAQFIEFAVKVLSPIAAFVGSLVGVAVWWTSYRTQLYQNTKLELDVLVAASDKATYDEKYRKFLEDLRKEKLAGLAFGCTVRTGELGRLMSYYDLGFANAREIGLAWMHRNDAPNPLSFRLHGFDRFAFLLATTYMVACLLVGMLFGAAVLFLPTQTSRWQYAPAVLCYFALPALTFWLTRSLWIADSLAKRESQHKASEGAHISQQP